MAGAVVAQDDEIAVPVSGHQVDVAVPIEVGVGDALARGRRRSCPVCHRHELQAAIVPVELVALARGIPRPHPAADGEDVEVTVAIHVEDRHTAGRLAPAPDRGGRDVGEGSGTVIPIHVVGGSGAGRAVDEIEIPIVVEVAPGAAVRANVEIGDSACTTGLGKRAAALVHEELIGDRVVEVRRDVEVGGLEAPGRGPGPAGAVELGPDAPLIEGAVRQRADEAVGRDARSRGHEGRGDQHHGVRGIVDLEQIVEHGWHEIGLCVCHGQRHEGRELGEHRRVRGREQRRGTRLQQDTLSGRASRGPDQQRSDEDEQRGEAAG